MKGNRAARAITAASLALVILVPSSQATYDPIGRGAVKLKLDKRFLSFLKRHGVKLSAKAPARLSGRVLALPATRGKVDPKAGLTHTRTEGTLIFRRGKRRLPFRRIELKANRNPLQAKVGGGQLKVATSPKPATARAGFATKVVARRLELTKKVITRLNKKLRLPRNTFFEGQRLGVLKARISPLITLIEPRGRATLVPDPAMLKKLEDHFVSLNPIAPAELAPGPVLTFPIARSGRLAPDASLGTLRTGGAFELLQLHGGQVFERELWPDLATALATAEPEIQPSPPYAGKQGRLAAFGLDLAAAARSSDPKSRTISVANAPLTLTAPTAAAFNEAFANGKPDFAEGERFGLLSFAAQGQ